MYGWTPAIVAQELGVFVTPSFEPGIALRVVMHFDVDDPYAVSATFVSEQGDGITWVFARDLLRLGLDGITGEGDVRGWPSRLDGLDMVVIALSSNAGEALLQLTASDVVTFLVATY